MGNFKDQMRKLKDNWLWIVLILLVLAFMNIGNVSVGSNMLSKGSGAYYAMEDSMGMVAENSRYYPSPSTDFAPEVEERLLTKTGSLSSEIERGSFSEKATLLKASVSNHDAILLSENVRDLGNKKHVYKRGTYTIKVPADEYDTFVSELKSYGEVTSLTESTTDITGSYLSLEAQLATEQARLKRYNEIATDAEDMEDRLTITDRIFSEEQTIAYLQQRLDKEGLKVTYSTVSFTMIEEAPSFVDVQVAKFSDLVESLVSSFNALLYVIFFLLPWLVLASIIWLVVRVVKRRN